MIFLESMEKLPGANFEACLELRRHYVERRYVPLDTLKTRIDLMSGTNKRYMPSKYSIRDLKPAIGIQNTPGMVKYTC